MDKQYWNKFYNKESLSKDISKCSSFALFCQKKILKEPRTIAELGCGNGRDALYFAKRGHSILALDQCVDQKVMNKRNHENLEYLEEDFVDYKFNQDIDVFYSRFTIHSITKEDQDKLLPNIYKSLPPKGLFCIEVRTTRDAKFGVGECVAENTYTNDEHKRRFVDSNVFVRDVLGIGFKVRYFTEEDNLSIYKDDNPVLMRLVLEK